MSYFSSFEQTKQYIDNYNDQPRYQEVLLFYFCQCGSMNMVKYLLDEKKMNIEARDGPGRTPLLFAISHNKINVVRFLLDRGANINAEDKKGLNSLGYAEDSEDNEAMKKLLKERGAKIKPLIRKKVINRKIKENYAMARYLSRKDDSFETELDKLMYL